MKDLMTDIGTATVAGSFDELATYYATDKNWRADELSAENLANDIRSILEVIQEHAQLAAEKEESESGVIDALTAVLDWYDNCGGPRQEDEAIAAARVALAKATGAAS